jgi:hypothetical protein
MKKALYHRVLLYLLLCLFTIPIAYCQDIAPPIDNTILERPTPLFNMQSNLGESSIGSDLLNEISDTLKRFNFDIMKLDNRDMQIESTRKISPNRDDFDKVIIWIEKDFRMPDRYVKVYFAFGRFMNIVSSDTKIRRIEITKIQEDKIVGDLKKSLISISQNK